MVPGRSGLPTWPNGLIGSMTHCNSYCAAAVASSQVCNAIGIDAEPNRSLTPGVLDRIASSTECEHVQYLHALHPHISFDRLLFSIKKSIYKAVFSNSGDSLRFKDVRVLVNPNGNLPHTQRAVPLISSHQRPAATGDSRPPGSLEDRGKTPAPTAAGPAPGTYRQGPPTR